MSKDAPENHKVSRDTPHHPYSILDSESELDISTYDHIEIGGCAISYPSSKEVLGADHFLVDPVEEEGRLDFSEFEELSTSDVCHGLENDFGILNTNLPHGVKHEMNFEFSPGMFQEAEEEKNLFLTREILSTCPNYLHDAAFPEKNSLLFYPPTKSFCLQKLDSECHPQDLEIRCSTAEMPGCSEAILPLPEVADHSSSFLDNMSLDELHEVFRSTFGRDTFINDKEWLKRRVMFGLQSIKELDNFTSLTASRSSSTENDDNSLFFSNIDEPEIVYGSLSEIHNGNLTRENNIWEPDSQHIVQTICQSESRISETPKLEDRNDGIATKKRLRKPTRRYIEELSEKKARNCNEKMRSHSSTLGNKVLSDGTGQLIYQDAGMTSAVLGNQFPSSSLQSRRGRPRKNHTLLLGVAKGNKELKPHSSRPKKSKNCELSESDSQDEVSFGFSSKIRKVGGRRKHHRQWTLAEVLKLVEGVSQYGVGRWTEIRRIHFSSSAYRTSVDLKDKWRNLLRATGVDIHGTKEIKTTKKHTSLPIPVSVTRRVRELSTIHPYPRQRKSGPQLTGTTANAEILGCDS